MALDHLPRACDRYRQSPEHMEVICATERAIHEAFVAANRRIFDGDVQRAVRDLTRSLRERGYEDLAADTGDELLAAGPRALLTWNILRNWIWHFEDEPSPNEEDLLGYLHSILDSLNTWSTPSKRSQGYLYYLRGFMAALNVDTRQLTPDGDGMAAEERPEDELLQLADDWLDAGMPPVGSAFLDLANHMLQDHHAAPVIHVCQYLIGKTNENDTTDALLPLLQRAYGQMGVPFGVS